MSIYKRGKTWWVDVYVGANRRRKRVSTHTDNITKARMIEQTILAVNKNVISRNQAVSIVDNVLPEEERGLLLRDVPEVYRRGIADEGLIITKNSLAHRICEVSKFAAWALRETRITYVSEVRAAISFDYSRVLRKTGITAKTLNAYVGELVTVWKWLQKHDYTHENPWTLAKVQNNADEQKHGRAFTPDEIGRIRSICRNVGHDWETAVLIALYTGLRQGDAVSLRWSEIDFSRGVIIHEPSKTKKHHITVNVPLHKTLAEWLKTHRNGSEYVTPLRVGKVGASTLPEGDKPFNRILDEAGITATEKEKLSFHCFRHTFVSRLAEAGVAEDVRMRLVGHTSTVNHALYNHDDVSARAAVALLP